MAEGGIELPIDDENTPLITTTDDRDGEEIEMNTLDSMGRKTSTSRFDPYGGQSRRKETSFLVRDKKTDQLDSLEESRNEAWEKIKDKFPEFNPKNSPFIAKMDEYNRVIVRLARRTSVEYPLFDGDKLNEKFTKNN